MALEPHSFKRVVLGLQSSAPSRVMQVAVELADMLHLDLLGLFLEDTNLHALACIPFAREFRPLGGGWHSIDLDRLTHDLDLAARSTERMFAGAVKRLQTRYQFEVFRGSITEMITSISQSSDIVMIMEPQSPAEWATQQFSWLFEAAFRSAAAIMLVPARIERTLGSVVAIAASPGDRSIRVAASIAVAAKEDLIIVEAYGGPSDDDSIRELVAGTGLNIERVAASKTLLSHANALSPLFRDLQERLVVVSHGAVDQDIILSLVAARRVPVLVIE